MHPPRHIRFWLATIGVAIATGLVLVQTAAPWVQRFRHSIAPGPLQSAAQSAPLDIQLVSFQKDRELSLTQSQQSINSFVPGQGINVQWPVDVYLLEITIPVEDGSRSPLIAEVYVPRRSEGDQTRYPLLVYGAGTTGLNSRCAPSREDERNPTLGNYPNQMVAQASQGYIVAMPNYEGLDTQERRHSYFNADLEARTLLATAEVLTNHSPAEQLPLRDTRVFFGGYSQGGHAAFAAADKAAVYTPRVQVGGVYGHGPTPDISDFLEFNPNLAPYFVYSYREYYPEIQAEQMLSARAVSRLDRASDLCVDEAFQFNSTSGSAMYTADFWQALQADDSDQALEASFPTLHHYFSLNDAGQSYRSYPTLILQGRQDPIAPPDSQQRFVDQLCQRSVPVTIRWYDNLNHFDTRQRSFRDTNDWINAIVNGEPVQTTCTDGDTL